VRGLRPDDVVTLERPVLVRDERTGGGSVHHAFLTKLERQDGQSVAIRAALRSPLDLSEITCPSRLECPARGTANVRPTLNIVPITGANDGNNW
jgi:hypothetical protein